MKTHVIQLDSFDDITSACDKMAWSKSARILLVWPPRGHVLYHPLDMVRLQRYAIKLGAQLALVCKDAEVQENARASGIPVFSSVDVAQRQTWRKPKEKKRNWKQIETKPFTENLAEYSAIRKQAASLNPIVRIAVFLCGLMAVVALGLFFLPGASIKIFPKKADQALSIKIWASPDISVPIISGGVPAHQISVVVEATAEMNTSGSIAIGEQKAVGVVNIKNLTNLPLTIPIGTSVMSLSQPPVRFQTIQEIVLDAGNKNAENVQIIALFPGNDGNLAAHSIVAVEGQMGINLAVDNPEATHGGSDKQTPAANANDVTLVKEQVQASLENIAKEKILQQLQDGQSFIQSSLQLRKILDEKITPTEGEPGDKLQIISRAEFTGWYVSQSDLEQVGLMVLDANLENGNKPQGSSLKISKTGDWTFGNNRAEVEILAVRQVSSKWSTDQLIEAVAGQNPGEVPLILSRVLPQEKPAEVTLSPSWWIRMPFLPFRIQVVAE